MIEEQGAEAVAVGAVGDALTEGKITDEEIENACRMIGTIPRSEGPTFRINAAHSPVLLARYRRSVPTLQRRRVWTSESLFLYARPPDVSRCVWASREGVAGGFPVCMASSLAMIGSSSGMYAR